MPAVAVIHLGLGADTHTLKLLGQEVEVRRFGAAGDLEAVRAQIAALDGQVDAIGLEGMPALLELGRARRPHSLGASLAALAPSTPVVDGGGVRAALERWGVLLAERLEPGIFSHKRVLMVPGLNHEGMAQALRRYGGQIRYADPLVYFGVPNFPGVSSEKALDQTAAPILDQLAAFPYQRLYPSPGRPRQPRPASPFLRADILAGDIGAIRRYAPPHLAHKIVVVPSASEEDLADLRGRGVTIAILLIPNFGATEGRRGYGVAAAEAVMAALRPSTAAALSEDTYLDMLADVAWQPEVRHLQPDEAGINRFAFVIHPLEVGFIHQHPLFRWTRLLPDSLVEAVAAYIPPIYLSRITGGRSPVTGQRIEGVLYSLGATPRQMMRHGERFTYVRLNQAARLAERQGARIMGLGAFTSVVGDAGITVAHEADIAITSGNSLTVAATLEAAKRAAVKMGTADLTQGRAMIIGATGSIGAVCARLLAQAIRDVVLVSIEPEKLIDLKRRILSETPAAQVVIATRADEWLPDCDLIVTATSAFGQRIMDITRCKPGAVVCDVARPPDINPDEAALRPDVLVIESGEVLIPGDIDFGYDIGLPPKTAYACLAETALLAMEGRFEDYTLGRNISMEQVKEIYRLFKKHQFELAGLRSFGKYVTDDYVAEKRALADALRADPARLAEVKVTAAARLAAIPPMSKGVRRDRRDVQKWTAWIGGLGVLGVWLMRRRSAHRRDQP